MKEFKPFCFEAVVLLLYVHVHVHVFLVYVHMYMCCWGYCSFSISFSMLCGALCT